MRIGTAFKAFFKALFNKEFAKNLASFMAGTMPAAQAPEPEPKVPLGAVQVLALLQREGRLLDFLQEDLESASDDQIGAVVRSTVYSGCRKAVKEYLTIVPAVEGEEGSEYTAEPGFDPNTVRLIGKVEGEPPFTGVLRHCGWKITDAKLPSAEKGSEIICPAEVEIQ